MMTRRDENEYIIPSILHVETSMMSNSAVSKRNRQLAYHRKPISMESGIRVPQVKSVFSQMVPKGQSAVSVAPKQVMHSR